MKKNKQNGKNSKNNIFEKNKDNSLKLLLQMEKNPIQKSQNQFFYDINNKNLDFCTQQCLEFASQYYHHKALVKINKQINSHQILTTNSSIAKQLEEIKQQYDSSTNSKGRCLKRRCVKLLCFFDEIKRFEFVKEYQSKTQQNQLTKLLYTNNQIYSNTIVSEVKIGKKVQSNIKKDNHPIIQQTKFAQISQFLKPVQFHTSYHNSHSLDRYFNPIRIQSNSLLATKKKKTLSLGKVINIHQILRANRVERSNDYEKQKQNYEFQQRIQKSMMDIHNELKQIKEKQIYNQQSLSELKIEQLENEIKQLNQRTFNYQLTPPPTFATRIIKLDSLHQKKSDRLQETRMTAHQDDKRNSSSQIVFRTQKIDPSKSSYYDASRRNYWNRNDYSNKLKNEYISKKIIINESKNSQQSIQKMKKSMNSVSNKKVKNKSLLSTRIAQIYKN